MCFSHFVSCTFESTRAIHPHCVVRRLQPERCNISTKIGTRGVETTGDVGAGIGVGAGVGAGAVEEDADSVPEVEMAEAHLR